MSTYNDASLIYYPSGYKASKAYSLKPTDGSGDLTFTRASTATRVNSAGLIESVATGVPRIDFTGAGCAKLLLEPQRSNLQTQSNGFLSNWNNNEVTTSVGESALISAETTTLITETAVNAVHRVVSVSAVTLTIGSVYTISFYAKSNGTRNIGLRTGFTGSSANIIFNPNTQTAVSVPAGFTTNITAANDGYYRYSITATAGAASDLISVVMFNGTSLVYTGTSESIYISAIQTELGAYPTSYIPTTTTAVTRVVDSASKTGMGYNLLNGYTVFFNFETLSVTAYNQFQFRQNASNYILRIGNNYNIGNALAQGPNILGKNKYALSVQNNGNYALYRNSILLANGTGVTANLEEIRSDLPGPHLIDSIILYEIALSNAELETLTTL